MQRHRRQPVHALHLGGTDRRRDEARRLRDILNSGLEQGHLSSDRLPDELDMARTHGASRNAIREAYALLVTEGRVERQVGSGSFMRTVPVRYPFDRIVEGSTIEDERRPLRSQRLLGFRVLETVPAGLRSSLGLPDSCRRLAVFERLTAMAGVPSDLRTFLLPLPDGLLVDIHACTTDVYLYLEQSLGITIDNGSRAVSAIAVDASSAALLEVPEGSPALFMESRLFDPNGNIILITYGRHSKDSLTVTFRAERPTQHRRAAGG
jgi:GntR family transcriptional regulator